jgi:hypothetical protein
LTESLAKENLKNIGRAWPTSLIILLFIVWQKDKGPGAAVLQPVAFTRKYFGSRASGEMELVVRENEVKFIQASLVVKST